MITMVIGLPGSGKTTWVKHHINQRSLVYDLDYIAAAFRLESPHESNNGAARSMANDLLFGFAANANKYSDDVYVIRTAPTDLELEYVKPEKLVICIAPRSAIRKGINNLKEKKDRIDQAIEWGEESGIRVFIQERK